MPFILRLIVCIAIFVGMISLYAWGLKSDAQFRQDRNVRRGKKVKGILDKLQADKEYGNTATNEYQRRALLEELLPFIMR